MHPVVGVDIREPNLGLISTQLLIHKLLLNLYIVCIPVFYFFSIWCLLNLTLSSSCGRNTQVHTWLQRNNTTQKNTTQAEENIRGRVKTPEEVFLLKALSRHFSFNFTLITPCRLVIVCRGAVSVGVRTTTEKHEDQGTRGGLEGCPG